MKLQRSAEDEIAAQVALWEGRTGQRWTDDHEPPHRRGSMPWERKGTFEHLLGDAQTDTEVPSFGRRMQGLSINETLNR